MPTKENMCLISKTSCDLLAVSHRHILLTKIKRLISVTESVWTTHYLYAIEQFSELVQELPASELHHHSNHGGLIDHTLETLHAGLRISQGYVLPPNTEPEKIYGAAEQWRFGVFITILAHDIGKILTDIDICYRIREEAFQSWHPWFGNIPIGAEYKFKYRSNTSSERISKNIHEYGSMSLLPKLLTKKAAVWVFEDRVLLSQILCTLVNATFGGHVISEIVRTADRKSTANDLGAETGIKTGDSNQIPLHEKIIVSLRKLIDDSELVRNKPGAAIWVGSDFTWVVSKAAMEAVRLQLVNSGHKGIPKNVVRFFQVLLDHKLIIPNNLGESVWTAEIIDYSKNWQQKLTFLKFKNEIIWPTRHPDIFDGEINPLDKNGKTLLDSTEVSDDTKGDALVQKPADAIFSSERTVTPMKSSKKKSKEGSNVRIGPLKSSHTYSNRGGEGVDIESKTSDKMMVVPKHYLSNPFVSWLLNGIDRRIIRVNESKAPVHILEKYVALVTPSIFIQYLNKNPLKKRIYEQRSESKNTYTVLQKELESLGIHQCGINGQNIHKLCVTGERSKSQLRAYLIKREYFPSLSSFTQNKAISID